MALQNGLDAFYLPKTKDVYMKLNNNEEFSSLKKRIRAAILINNQFDNPFHENIDTENSKIHELFSGYLALIENETENFDEMKVLLGEKLKSKIMKIFMQ